GQGPSIHTALPILARCGWPAGPQDGQAAREPGCTPSPLPSPAGTPPRDALVAGGGGVRIGAVETPLEEDPVLLQPRRNLRPLVASTLDEAPGAVEPLGVAHEAAGVEAQGGRSRRPGLGNQPVEDGGADVAPSEARDDIHALDLGDVLR